MCLPRKNNVPHQFLLEPHERLPAVQVLDGEHAASVAKLSPEPRIPMQTHHCIG